MGCSIWSARPLTPPVDRLAMAMVLQLVVEADEHLQRPRSDGLVEEAAMEARQIILDNRRRLRLQDDGCDG